MTDYSTVTETWGLPASGEQLAMQHFRYRRAAELAAAGDVLEIGCGTGMGLSLLSRRARLAVGGDYTMNLLREAREHVPQAALVRFDAQALPFSDSSFDAVMLLEMLYYVPDRQAALAETRRVLRPGGRVLVCVPNCERLDFNPSPFAVGYPSASELRGLLERAGFHAEVYGGFPVDADSGGVLSALRHVAVRYHLVPRSMRMKSLVKRVLYRGRLPRLGEVTETGPSDGLDWTALDARPQPGFKNLYALGRAR